MSTHFNVYSLQVPYTCLCLSVVLSLFLFKAFLMYLNTSCSLDKAFLLFQSLSLIPRLIVTLFLKSPPANDMVPQYSILDIKYLLKGRSKHSLFCRGSLYILVIQWERPALCIITILKVQVT